MLSKAERTTLFMRAFGTLQLATYRPSDITCFPNAPASSYAFAKLFEHLPHSVTGVGKELSRGDDEHDPLWTTESGRRTALLGFVAVVRMSTGPVSVHVLCA